MKVSTHIQPYSATVVSEQDQTVFQCAEVRRSGKIWKIQGYYRIVVKNLNFPIPKKNPEGIKILVHKNGVEGVTIDKRGQVTIWVDDIAILDKDKHHIVKSTKKAAKYLGKKKSDLLPKQEVAQEDGDLFNAF